jgi:MinD superfamily P-loop ATPase
MKEITVISGKGGTGKTTLTAALASMGKEQVLCDADVDAADLHLILKPDIKETYVFEGAWVARINQNLCASCGICSEYCRFDAIEMDDSGLRRINPYKCEGCRLCERICPSKAISSEKSTNNSWYVSETRAGIMTHASMGPGEENSGKLVTQVRNKAREIAKDKGAHFILTDGPPGTGCAAISSITGTDLVLLVMESSRSSLHDAQRLIELVRQFEIPLYVIINKFDIHLRTTHEIESYLAKQLIPVLCKIPFDTAVVKAMLKGLSFPEFEPDSEITRMLADARNKLLHEIEVLG